MRYSRVTALAGLFAVAGCGVELEHGLDERQANEVLAALEHAGVGADKQADDGRAGSYKIIVARGEAAHAFALLEARDLPRRDRRGLDETFGADALLPSPIEERARYGAALGVELERTLESLPGVSAARVHLALPPEELSAGDAAHARPTASVLLKVARPQALSEPELKRLVAGAVHDLQPADVSVVIARAEADPAAPPFERIGPLRVAKGERPLVVGLAVAALGLVLVLALALVWAALRLGRLGRARPEA